MNFGHIFFLTLMQLIYWHIFVFLWDCGTFLKKHIRCFVMETRSLFADATFCKFLKLNNVIMRYYKLATVDSEIFERVYFRETSHMRNRAYAMFRENKILTNWRNHSVVY